MNNRPLGCKAYERGDQWFCDQCGVTWDMNDDDPPECQLEPVRVNIGTPVRDKEKAAKAVNDIKGILNHE